MKKSAQLSPGILLLALSLVFALLFFGCEQSDPFSAGGAREKSSTPSQKINFLRFSHPSPSLNKLISVSQWVNKDVGATLGLTHGSPTANRSLHVLMVVWDIPYGSQHVLRKNLLESWGYTVTVIDDDVSQAAFDAAIANADVVYVPKTISDKNLKDKLKNAAIGVVSEKMPLDDEFGFAAIAGNSYAGTLVKITDNTHYITAPFNIGMLSILNSSYDLTYMRETLAPGIRVLGERPGSSDPVLAVFESGAALYGGGTAVKRRVRLPWGGKSFDFDDLNQNGRTMLKRALEWAGEIELSYASVSLQILPGSMSNDAEIGLNLETTELQGGVAVTFQPHGTVFSTPAILNITAHGVDFAGVDPNSVDIYYDNPETGLWEPMQRDQLIVDIISGTVQVINAQLPHFSRYALGAE